MCYYNYVTCVFLQWMRERLQDLSLLVESSDICVMVVGKGGCGKSSLLRSYCSHVRGEDVVFLHLGDQIDSKVISSSDTLESCTPSQVKILTVNHDVVAVHRN